MLLSSMDHLGYYSMPKDNNFLELDASAGVAGPDGYALPPEDLGVVSYMNEENSPKNGTKSSLYKTELCKRFSEFGNCRYGGASPSLTSLLLPINVTSLDSLSHLRRTPSQVQNHRMEAAGFLQSILSAKCQFAHGR
ncbi:hypothetical protein P3T76_011006 [Phytophthora citrophthora]|uniref:C3H1-type domain-containing protein n=1 Tax=Phytophthora citrophthora TaxID=4793 RepID=A0AAD9G9S3_9STRA|nr:hypothetical protein P3T76_011006 [Phytophthora citrophthora]